MRMCVFLTPRIKEKTFRGNCGLFPAFGTILRTYADPGFANSPQIISLSDVFISPLEDLCVQSIPIYLNNSFQLNLTGSAIS
jgi:hypothetical protein